PAHGRRVDAAADLLAGHSAVRPADNLGRGFHARRAWRRWGRQLRPWRDQRQFGVPDARRGAGRDRAPRCRQAAVEALPFVRGHTYRNCVMLGAGGFGYFLIDARYSSTTLSAGPDTQPNNPATTRSSWGTFRCCRPSDNLPPERWLKNTRLTLLTVARRMNVGEVDAALLPPSHHQIAPPTTQP